MRVSRFCSLLTLASCAGASACGTSALPIDFLAQGSEPAQAADAGAVWDAANDASTLDAAATGGKEPRAGSRSFPGSAAGRDGSSIDAGGIGPIGITDPTLTGPLVPDAGSIPERPCPDGVYAGDLILQTRMDVERVKGCSRIAGNLIIASSTLEDLRGLEALRVVDNTLRIVPEAWDTIGVDPRSAPDSVLKSLAGLEGLTSVLALELMVVPLDSLESLAHLEHAERVIIWNVARLRDLQGLSRLAWNMLIVAQNPDLQSLDGLSDGTSNAAQLVVYDNPNFETLANWHAPTKLDSLWLLNLPMLTSLAGLEALETVGQLIVDACNSLRDLSGLEKLTSVSSAHIQDNERLQSLAGLSIQHGATDLAIVNNPQLESLGRVIGAQATQLQAIQLFGLPKLTSLADFGELPAAATLTIQTCDGLVDLTGLNMLRNVNSLQLIDSIGITSLKGLDSLQSANTLYIDGLTALSSLQGAPQLRELGHLTLLNSPKIADLRGLDGLTRVSQMSARSNAGLHNLQGLEHLEQLSIVELEANSSLKSLQGLPALDTFMGVTLTDNPQLTSLQGLASASTINELQIINDAALGDLAGLERLSSTDVLTLEDNPVLLSLRGLSGLTNAGKISIQGNHRLPQCEVDWLGARLGIALPGPLNGPPGMCAP